MTENEIPVDRLRKPEREILAYSASFRNAVIDAAIQNIGFAMRLVLLNEAKHVEASQPTYEQPATISTPEPQAYSTMPEYPLASTQSSTSTTPYHGEGASIDDYMTPTYSQELGPQVSDFEQKAAPAPQYRPMTDDAQALAEQARQQITDIDNQTNMVAG